MLELSKTISKYIHGIGSFKYKGKTYLLDDAFVSSHYMKCDVCGTYPISDISVIRNEYSNRLNACYNCINILTNQNLSRGFKTYRKKRENIIENRKYIDGLSSILVAYERDELPFKISSEDIEKLRKTYSQICNCLNPKTKQKQLADCYISYSIEILRDNKNDLTFKN